MSPATESLASRGVISSQARQPAFEELEPRLLLSAAQHPEIPLTTITPDAYEPNNQSWAAKSVTLDTNADATVSALTIDSASDVDWFSFTTPYGITGAVQVGLAGVSGGLTGHVGLYDSIVGSLSDMYGGIYTTLYGPKATADAGGTNQSVTLNWAGLKPGTTYYVEASGLSSTTGAYTLNIACAMLSPDADEPNNTAATATNLTSLLNSGNGACCQTSLSISRSDDEDWFRIDTPANTDGNLTAKVSNLTGGLQGLVWVYQQYSWGMAPASLSAYASWTGGSGQATVYNAQPNTTYYIRVDNFYNETGGYQLDVTLPLDTLAKDPYEGGLGNGVSWFATPMPSGNTVSGASIYNSSAVEWFSFTAPSDGTEQVDLTNVSGGLIPQVAVYDSPVASLADQYGGVYTTIYAPMGQAEAAGANQGVSFSVAGLSAGRTYFMKVSGKNHSTGHYNLGVTHLQTLSLVISGPGSVNEDSAAGYTVEAYYNGYPAQDVTTGAAWTQTSGGAAIGYHTGVLTVFHIMSDGSTTVSATYGGVTATKAVTLEYIHQVIAFYVTGPGSVAQNTSASYQAMEVWDNGTQHDVTATAFWSQTSSHAAIDQITGLLRVGNLDPLVPQEMDTVTATDGTWKASTPVLLTIPPQPPVIPGQVVYMGQFLAHYSPYEQGGGPPGTITFNLTIWMLPVVAEGGIQTYLIQQVMCSDPFFGCQVPTALTAQVWSLPYPPGDSSLFGDMWISFPNGASLATYGGVHMTSDGRIIGNLLTPDSNWQAGKAGHSLWWYDLPDGDEIDSWSWSLTLQ